MAFDPVAVARHRAASVSLCAIAFGTQKVKYAADFTSPCGTVALGFGPGIGCGRDMLAGQTIVQVIDGGPWFHVGCIKLAHNHIDSEISRCEKML